MIYSVSSSQQRGFTLPEILIALTLGIFLLAAALQVYEISKKGSRSTVASAFMIDGGRATAALLSKTLKRTPDWGCWSTDNDATTLTDGVDVHVTVGLEELRPLKAPADVDGEPDSLVINYMSQSSSTLAADANIEADPVLTVDDISAIQVHGTALRAGDIVVVHDCVASDVLVVSDVNADTNEITVSCTNCGARNFSVGAQVAAIESFKFYIGDYNLCMSKNYNDQNCSASEELMTDVVDMQIHYGLDEDGDRQVERYALAKHMDSEDWSRTQTLQISLLLRSAEDRVTDTKQAFFFDGVARTAPDNRLYREQTVFVNLRNYRPYL